MSAPAPRSGPFAALGNAFYLGTSWTWVIGMLFPALILRDYGLWGFVAFAVPNVVGAAAMGFVLTPERAKNILERHKTACAWFSVVTMAFHAFITMWLVRELFGLAGLLLLGGTFSFCWVVHEKFGAYGRWLLSTVVWLISIGLFAKGMTTEGAWAGASWKMGAQGEPGLLAFIPASLLGFALCPYLDLTFLKARAETDRNAGRTAFALGFGVVFCTMIFFTVCYGEKLWGFFAGNNNELGTPWSWILMLHLCMQIGLTLGWHDIEMPRTKEPSLTKRLFSWAMIPSAFILAGVAHFYPNLGEVFYRSFLLLYGTVLPAYVLLKMIPTRAPVSPRFRTIVFICAALLSYPLAWGAFVLMHHWMVIPSTAVLTLAFIAVQFGPKAGEPQPHEP